VVESPSIVLCDSFGICNLDVLMKLIDVENADRICASLLGKIAPPSCSTATMAMIVLTYRLLSPAASFDGQLCMQLHSIRGKNFVFSFNSKRILWQRWICPDLFLEPCSHTVVQLINSLQPLIFLLPTPFCHMREGMRSSSRTLPSNTTLFPPIFH